MVNLSSRKHNTEFDTLHFVHYQKYINSRYCEFTITDKDERPPTHILQIEKCCLLFFFKVLLNPGQQLLLNDAKNA